MEQDEDGNLSGRLGKDWRPKHDMREFKVYSVYCQSCEAGWDMRKRPDTEIWCPFCEADEPCKVKETK